MEDLAEQEEQVLWGRTGRLFSLETARRKQMGHICHCGITRVWYLTTPVYRFTPVYTGLPTVRSIGEVHGNKGSARPRSKIN